MKTICLFCICLILAAPAAIKAGSEKTGDSEVEYFAVFMESKKAGYARNDRAVSNGKVTTTSEVSLTISRAGIPLTVKMISESVETAEGKPISFKSIQDLGLMKMEVSGEMQPGGKLTLVSNSLGSVRRKVIDWPEHALMAEGLRLLQESKGLKEGTEYSYKIFEPSMATVLDAKTIVGPTKPVDLLGRVVNLTEMTNILSVPGMGEIASKSYVDEDFKLQKDIMPIMNINVEMVACPKEIALAKNDVVELIGKMFIDSPVRLNDLESIESVTYHMAPLADAKMTIPANDNQQVRKSADGKVVLTVKPVVAPAGVDFPYKGSDAEALEALKPTQFVQSDHEEVIELAHRAVGETKDAAEAIDKIEAFVAEYVANKNLSVGYASAVEVARSKQGDCTEHAVLAAALCRAVGIPAQVATGLAYVGEWRAMESGFGGHAWTQAYIGGQWIGLDAAFRGSGRGGYDAGHIALAAGNGDPGDFFSLVTTMGQFEFEKIEVKRK